MCIAIVSEFGVPLPDEATLKRCWNDNSDGAGYAYLTDKDTWEIKKGFMKWMDFKKSLDAEKFVDENTVVMHFRIGTSGRCPHKAGELGKGEMCTHPFPISNKTDMLESLRIDSSTIVIHNGIVGNGAGFLSDTMIAIRDHISVLWPFDKKDEAVQALL
jgi:predicted glutamine amidotransferase